MTDSEIIVLGLVAEQPRHGTEIEREIIRRGMREWTDIGFSSIYQVQNKLEKAGLLTSTLLAQGQGPARKVLSPTPAGFSVLQQEVMSRLSMPSVQSSWFQLGLAFSGFISPQELAACLENCHRTLVEKTKAIQSKWLQDQSAGLPAHVNLLFDHSLMQLKSEIEWLEKVIATLLHDPLEN